MSVIDDVKAHLDIVDVASGYVTLQKAGRNYKALCPFHQEKTPSFVIFPDTQTWRCFGACGEGGDVFGLVMRSEGWDFSETLRELAQRAGVELTQYTPEQKQHQAEAERLRDLLEEAARFFHDQLRQSPAAQTTREYVMQRGISETSAEAFMLGYAPDDWHQTRQHLQMHEYTPEEIVKAGVAIRNDAGNIYDRFRHRLMIPIRDGRGSTVGFGARALDRDAVPKYLNSPQGPLFDKSRLLYGLDMARREIRETETAVIVEGYMDVIQAYQAGFINIVAQMGTALTEIQLRQLNQYASCLILALDPDAAGIKATMRGLNLAQQTLDDEQVPTFDPRGMMRYTGMLNLDIRVASLPGGQDPDDLIRENPEAWESLVAQAVPVADYVIQRGTAHLTGQSSYHEREQVARELLPILTATENNLQRSGNLQELARRIQIDESLLIQWAQRRQNFENRALPTVRQQRKLAERSAQPITVSRPPGHADFREDLCLWLLIEEPERLFDINRVLGELQAGISTQTPALESLNADDFSRTDYQAIFQELKQALYQNELSPLDYLYEHLPPELTEVVEQLQIAPLEKFQQSLQKSLTFELPSVIKEQVRVNTLPEPGTTLFIREALALRERRLDSELHELYFLQQDAQNQDAVLVEQLSQNISQAYTARQSVALALKRMTSLARDK